MRSRLAEPAFRSAPSIRALAVRAALLLLASACSTGISASEPRGEGDGEAPAQGGSEPSEPSAGFAPAPAGRFARLTHAQWENTVRDLLRLDDVSGLSSTFPSDARTAGFLFDNHELSLEVDQVLSGAYASAAEALAARVSQDPAALARLLPPEVGSERERARAFVTQLGERAFRRPLDAGEVDTFSSLFELGKNAYDDASGFTAGARFVIEAFLRSPFFLYRVESSTAPVGATIPLSDYEVAQRLSYLFTGSMPDDALFEAARAGSLTRPRDVRLQAIRLLTTPGARRSIVSFHDQLLDFEKYETISPSPRVFPGLAETYADEVRTSSELFIQDLVVGRAGTFADLMTSTEAFVNDDLARVYGLDGQFGPDFVKVELPADERRGFFNQLGFLAANATSVNPDPIHRGVFMATRVLCLGIAAPPDGVPPLPPIENGTNREIVENHTQSSPVCQACHATLINPLGFPFENYDAAGAYRTSDNGEPVDASSRPTIDGEPRDIANSIELAEILSQSRQAHECFVSHLAEYTFGRERGRADGDLIEALTEASLGGAPILELLVRIAESPAFLTRSTEELP
jgi:uncharacterized protein DUF1592/uncharacterized protein DUF1588/uncharacterized protein DUF1595/uncharacterized protein DUF1587/uncharacterized protein DUF1585